MSIMYAQMGLAVADSFFGYQTAKYEHKMRKAQQDYQNTLTAMSTTRNLNNLTRNEISARDAFTRAGAALEVQRMRNKSTATVSAAAAGVKGSAVSATMRGIQRSSLQAKTAHAERVKQQGRQNFTARADAVLSGIYGRDISVLPKPSAASALLGLGARMVDVWDSHQPDGGKTTDVIANWGRE